MDSKKRLEGVYREEQGKLISWLNPRVGEDSAQDILQDVAARAFANLDALEPVRDLTAWFWRSVRNAVIDVWRARGRRVRAGESDLEDFDAVMDDALNDAADDLARAEILDALSAAIDELPEEQRQVIIAQTLEGETFSALSRRSGVSVDTLAARKRYAVSRLRKSLSEFYQ